MLDLSTAPRRIAGLSVFEDHEDAGLVRLLTDRPRLVAEPGPGISLVLYRGEPGDDAASGGLLQVEVELAPETAQIDGVRATLEAEGRTPRLVPPDWLDGSARVVGWLAQVGGAHSPLQLADARPSLVGWPRVTLAARLDTAAASLAAAALRGDALPTGVVLELGFQGLAGPLTVTAEADLGAVHDRLTAAGALTTPIARATLEATWEELARDNIVRIAATDASGEVESQRAEALRRVAEDLTHRMLTPTLPPEAPPLLPDAAVAPIELSFRLTLRREELATTAQWSWTERSATRVTHYAAATLVDLLGDRTADDVMTLLDLASDQPRALEVELVDSLEEAGLAAIEVDLAIRGDDSRVDTIVLTSEHPRSTLAAAPPGTLRYRLRSRYDRNKTSRPDETTPWEQLDGLMLVIVPSAAFPPRRLRVVPAVPLAGDAEVHVTVTAPGEEPRSRALTAEVQGWDVVFPGAREQRVGVTAAWRPWPGGPVVERLLTGVDTPFVVLTSPFAPSTELSFVPVLENDVVGLVVDLVVPDGVWVEPTSLAWDRSDLAPVDVTVRRLSDVTTPLAYNLTTIRPGGDPITGQHTVEGSFVFVGAGRPLVWRRHTLTTADGGPLRGSAPVVELVLEAGDEQVKVVVDDDRSTHEVSFTLPRDTQPTELTTRVHQASGGVLIEVVGEIGELVVIPAVPRSPEPTDVPRSGAPPVPACQGPPPDQPSLG